MMEASNEARVLVLYTGGTIGMLKSANGYAPHAGFLASNLRSQSRFHDPGESSVFANSSSVHAYSSWSLNEATRAASGSTTPIVPPHGATDGEIPVKTTTGDKLLPSLVTPRSAQGKRIRYAILEYDTLIDSSEVELSDWIRIASDIELNYALYDAFVVLHGTDTMAYSASALSFLLEDLGKTVILTGSQIPLSELFNDSIDNLLGALIVAGHYTIPEVCLFFNHKLLRGNRAIKASSEEFNAFDSPNLPPLANVGIEIDVAWAEVLRPGVRAFRAHKAMSDKVATLRIFPGISGSAVRAFLQADDVKGVVLESFGAGNAPRKEALLSAFREATDRGVVIVNVSQCTTGAVAPDIYETGRALAAVGIIGGADMTVECALAKLSYLLSKPDLSPAQVRTLISRPLRGELTLPSSVPTFASPTQTGDRLRTLFGLVLDTSPLHPAGALPPPRPRGKSASDSAVVPGVAPLPAEFAGPWPATRREAEEAERAILPFLVGQAAAKQGPLLASLVEALKGAARGDETMLGVGLGAGEAGAGVGLETAVTQLNEPATAALQTPLHLAVLSAQPANVALLLAHGASVHARDVLGHTPLYYAARQGGGGMEMVRALRAAGAHLGEAEIERGDVGLELARADGEGKEVWRVAAGEEGLTRASEAVLGLMD